MEYIALIPEIEIAWLAGLLESEGSFVLPTPSSPRQPGILLCMTDEDVVQKVAAILQINYIYLQKRKENWLPAYRIQLKGTRAVAVMRRVRPYMGLRRGAKIDQIIADYESKPKLRRLSEEEARAILSQKGQSRARDVAAEHHLHIKTIEEIWRGKRWGQLQGY